jgi:hypothetical protein
VSRARSGPSRYAPEPQRLQYRTLTFRTCESTTLEQASSPSPGLLPTFMKSTAPDSTHLLQPLNLRPHGDTRGPHVIGAKAEVRVGGSLRGVLPCQLYWRIDL